jgi:hypothetical protein
MAESGVAPGKGKWKGTGKAKGILTVLVVSQITIRSNDTRDGDVSSTSRTSDIIEQCFLLD